MLDSSATCCSCERMCWLHATPPATTKCLHTQTRLQAHQHSVGSMGILMKNPDVCMCVCLCVCVLVVELRDLQSFAAA